MATSRSDAVLDCGEKRPFWVSWTEGHIRVGRGDSLGEQIISGYSDPQFRYVHAVGISTEDDKDGQWTVQQTSGSLMIHSN